ncbi:hypothetical protein PGTUg99_010637 [Puccinia graminis f. sp. tritici]|uniref:Uncharacterized protein n=1 Tax=Puccinia graminis f. sp. tritici TaxID=56615 RepID=A0A5B0PT09_PUCGR|nr:hypothetical protein PGTUg99_010637 [Puccinia graminis f. sp. tritici]
MFHGSPTSWDHQAQLTDVDIDNAFTNWNHRPQLTNAEMGEGFNLGFEDPSNLLGWFDHPGIQSETIEHGFPNHQILEPSYGAAASHQSLSGFYPVNGPTIDSILKTQTHDNLNIGVQKDECSQPNHHMFIPPLFTLGELPAYNHVSSDSTQYQSWLKAQASGSNHGGLAAQEVGPAPDYWEPIPNQQFSQQQDMQLRSLPSSSGATLNDIDSPHLPKNPTKHLPKKVDKRVSGMPVGDTRDGQEEILFEPLIDHLWQFAWINTLNFPQKKRLTAKRGHDYSNIRDKLLQDIVCKYGKEQICPRLMKIVSIPAASSHSEVLPAALELLEEIQLRNKQFLDVFTPPHEVAAEEEIFDPSKEMNDPILNEQFVMYNWFVKQLVSTNQLPGASNEHPSNLIQKAVLTYLEIDIHRKELSEDHWKTIRFSNKKNLTPFSITILEAIKTKIALYILGQYYKSSNPEKWDFYIVHDSNFIKIFSLLKKYHYLAKPARIRAFNGICSKLDVLPWKEPLQSMDRLETGRHSFLKTLDKFGLHSVEYYFLNK